MVGGVGRNATINLSSILRAQYSSGKVALPVDGAIYARFRHVQGVPSVGGRVGYSVSKLQVIDLLVDRLVRLSGREIHAPQPANEAQARSMITDLASKLHTELERANRVNSSVTAGIAEPGLLLNLVA